MTWREVYFATIAARTHGLQLQHLRVHLAAIFSANELMLDSKWMFVQRVMKFAPIVPGSGVAARPWFVFGVE